MAKKQINNHDEVFEAIASTLDIPETAYQEAQERYKDLGEWLERLDSKVQSYSPKIYPQGSFALGTAIRPVNDSDDYDLDVVCRVNSDTAHHSMAELKALVGFELKGYAAHRRIAKTPEDKRRCWTLEYKGQANFHIDILPALPNAERYKVMVEGYLQMTADQKQSIRNHAIAITDKTDPNYNARSVHWPISNPKGYAIWFNARQAQVLNKRRQAVLEKNRLKYSSLDAVPNYVVKTPLQRAVQLLKRHRDMMFQHRDDKPISIIITTLASHAYNGEETISQALRTILKNMDAHIKHRNGRTWIANPVNPEENFADKWAENPKKEVAFREWLEQAQYDFGLYLSAEYDQLPAEFKQSISENTIRKVLASFTFGLSVSTIKSVAAEAQKDKIISTKTGTKPWAPLKK